MISRAVTPNALACAIMRARFAAAISDFDGTQPVLRHSPPIRPFSTSTTGTPKAAAAAATERPPEPPPMTQMSGRKTSTMPLPWRNGAARAHAPRYYWDQRKNAEQPERREQFQRRAGVRINIEPAIGASGGETRPEAGQLGGDDVLQACSQKCEHEGRGQDADGSCGHERLQPNARKGGNKIDQPERKERYQPQK